MYKYTSRFSLILILICLLYHDIFAQGRAIVKIIDIKGMRRVEEGAIRKRLSQKEGQPISEESITDDIKNIYKMGYFEDVRVGAETFEGGLKLIYKVKEKPSIIKISFQGNEKFDDDKLLGQIKITTGAISDATLIQDNVLTLKSFYEGEGYRLAHIVPILKKLNEDEVTLTFLINEGEKIKIKEIIVKGNKALSDSEIEKVMKTKRWRIFSFFTSSGYFKESEMKADVERVRELYYNHGYLNIKISEPEIQIEKGIIVSVMVSEGPQYRTSSIRFKGNNASDEKSIKSMFPLEEGEVFSKKKLREGIRNITEYYTERGYALASVEPEIVPDEKTLDVRITVNIEEGEIYRIGRIEVAGNTKTRDKVIRREVRLDEEDIFNSKLLRRSYERINNLNFFETVEFVPKPDVEKKLVDVDIKVKEKSTGFLSIGGGYSTSERWVGMIDVTEANLFGTGKQIRFKGQLSSESTLYEISYTNSWFLDRPMAMTLSLYNTEKDYITYDREATGGSIGFSKRFKEYWSSGITYRYESVSINDVSADASNIIQDQVGTRVTSSITPSVIRDTRDNFIDPSKGSKNSLYLTYAGIGGDNYFLKGDFNSAWFFPVGRSTIMLRGQIGYATGLFDRELPLYERFYLGGIYTIRGLGFGEGGPRDENNEVIGGTSELLFNTEYIFPLVEEIKFKGLVFFDAGRAYDTSENFGTDLRYTTGFGIRWGSPIGPIRLEYGINLNPRDDERPNKIEFAFGWFF